MTRPSGFNRSAGLQFNVGSRGLPSVMVAGVCLVSIATVLAQSAPTSSNKTAAAPPAPLAVSQEVKDIYDRSRRAVVKVHAQDEHSDIYGTGFFIDPTGTLYTATSVVGDAANFSVEYKGKTYAARLIVADTRSNIALLKVDAATPALPIGTTSDLEVATPVVTIG